MKTFLAWLILAMAPLAFGQSYTTITAVGVKVDNGTGGAVAPPAGSNLCFLGVDPTGTAITYVPAGGSPVTGPVCQTLNSSGSLTGALQVANPQTALPAGIRYNITVSNGTTNYITIPMAQISGSAFAFNTYALPVNGFALGVGSPHLACSNGATWTSTTYPSGSDAFTCTLVSGVGQWQTYPKGGSYCPAGMSYQTPQISGKPFCLPPVISGSGIPTGSCTKNSTYFQQDNPGVVYGCFSDTWVLIAGSGGGGSGLTSFQGRSTPAATLQTSDVTGILANSPFGLNGSDGILYDSGSGTFSKSAQWSIQSGTLIGTGVVNLSNGTSNTIHLDPSDGSIFFVGGNFAVNTNGVIWGGGPYISSSSQVCQTSGVGCPPGNNPQYQTVQNETTVFTPRPKTFFSSTSGIAVADDPGNSSTDVSLSQIPNSSLANNSITINVTGSATGGGTVALGGSTTIDVTGGGTGSSPGAPAGSSQFSNLDGTGFDGNGIIDTDVFLSGGGNNGIATAAAAASCTTPSCNLLVPSSSISTEISAPLPTSSGKQSSTVQDARGNALAVLAVNPQGLYNIADQYQGLPQDLYPDFLVYTNPNTGSPNQGTAQAWRNHTAIYSSPGFSNGASGCPLNCPLPPYTGVANWTVMSDNTSFVSFNTAGIRQSNGQNDFCYGIGDCTLGTGYLYSYYSGGFVAPSDEGFYSFGASHGFTNANFQGTLATITDINHIKVTPTQFGGTQGQGRFLFDSTGAVDASGNSLKKVFADDVHAAGEIGYTLPYATVVVNSANFPVSTATGALATACLVPVQFGGLASTSCNVTVLTGTFNTSSPVCFMGTQANQMDIGVQLSSATAITGGVQTLTGEFHRSVGGIPVYVFQGGMCGSGIDLEGDDVVGINGPVNGSFFPIMGSIDAHTVVVANYNSSQLAAGIPNISSNFVTTAVGSGKTQGGYMLANLVRTSGKVTADISTGANPLFLNTARYYTITGCSDTTFNQFQNPNPASVLPNGQLSFTANGTGLPDSTCTSAKLTSQFSIVSFYWAAEAYDVENHADGINPRTAVDGTMAISWQPNFIVGDAMVMPTHYSAAASGINIDMDLSQSTQFPQSAFRATLQGTSAFGGSAFSAENFADAGQDFGFTATLGGTNAPSSVMTASGLWSNGFAMQLAPITGGSVISVGFAPNYYSSNPDGGNSYLHYDLFNLENGLSKIHFDEPIQTFSFQYPNNQISTSFSVSPFLINSSVTHVLANAQFSTPSGGFGPVLPSGQMITCNATRQGNTFAPVGSLSPNCYDNAIAKPVVVPTIVGTPATVLYEYFIAVHFPYGDTFSVSSSVIGASALGGGNFNTISCSVVPLGSTGTVYVEEGITMASISTGTCSGPTGSVVDTGSYGSSISNTTLSAGGELIGGAFVANGAKGVFGWTDPDTTGEGGVNDPTIVHTQISQASAGIVSVDTTVAGNGLGKLEAAGFLGTGTGAFMGSNTASPTDLVGEITLSGGTGSRTFSTTMANRPECFIHDHTTPANDSANTFVVTATSLTVTSIGLSDVIGYGCIGRN